MDLAGTASRSVRDRNQNDPEETIAVLNTSASGWLLYIDQDGVETHSQNFISNCMIQEASGDQNAITLNDTRGRSYDVKLEATFATRDLLLGGDRANVHVLATLKNEGTIRVTSDNGASLSIGLTAGEFPAIHIDQQINGEHSFWVLPWSPVFTFDCFYLSDR